MSFLLERLCIWPDSTGRGVQSVDEEAAIMAQIQRILASRRRGDEFVAAVPWGLQAVVEMNAMNKVQLDRYARELTQAIARHEPRLRGVEVKIEPTGDVMMPHQLVISGVFPGEAQARSVNMTLPN